MKMKDNKTPQGQITDYKERLRKISDPVKRAEEGCRIADEIFAAKKKRLGIWFHFVHFLNNFRDRFLYKERKIFR